MRRTSELRRARELFSDAIRSLTSTGNQKERLVNALVYSLGNLDRPPTEIANRFSLLMARFNTGERYDTIVSELDEVELDAVVTDIVDMAETIDRLWHQA